ncbi:hypothetical protein GGI35DRAFT_430381, partial [Trichoderma velutinum]
CWILSLFLSLHDSSFPYFFFFCGVHESWILGIRLGVESITVTSRYLLDIISTNVPTQISPGLCFSSSFWVNGILDIPTAVNWNT